MVTIISNSALIDHLVTPPVIPTLVIDKASPLTINDLLLSPLFTLPFCFSIPSPILIPIVD